MPHFLWRGSTERDTRQYIIALSYKCGKKSMSKLKKNAIYWISLSSLLVGTVIAALGFLFIESQHQSFVESRVAPTRIRIEALSTNLASDMRSRALDWSNWDDSYDFSKTGSKLFIKENVNKTALENLQLDEMSFISNDGRVLASFEITKGPDRHSWEIVSQQKDIIKNSLVHKETVEFFQFSNGVLKIISVSPILKSDRSGEATAVFVISKIISDDYLEKSLGQDVVLTPTSPPDHNKDFFDYEIELKNFDGKIFPIGFVRIPIENTPLDYAKMYLPISILILIFYFAYIIFKYMEYRVISRITSLDQGVRNLTINGGIGYLSVDNDDDEISSLTANINIFCKRLRDSLLEEERLKSEALAAAEAAKLAEKAKANFVAVTSHEIRTPLAVVMGGIEMLRLLDLGGSAPRMLERLDRGANRLKEVVDGVLDFSRIEHEGVHVEKQPIVLQDFLEEVVQSYRPLMAAKGLAFDLVCEPERSAVYTDPFRLQQVLTNLLDNALKFTVQGSVQVRLARLMDDRFSISVTDTGIGLARQQSERIFAPFTQAEQSTMRRFGGTGLGLSICRNIVKALGGEIGCDSKPGQGATFWFHLPLQAAPWPEKPEGHAVQDDMADAAMAIGPEVQAMHLLLVEDNPLVAEMLQHQLEAIGHDVTSVGNGLQAYNAASQKAYDAILMDLHMPVMDGMTATKAIRELDSLRGQVPVVALSADTHLTYQVANDLFDAHLAKPCGIADLRVTLQSVARPGRRSAIPLSQGAAEAFGEPILSPALISQHEDAWGRETLKKHLLKMVDAMNEAEPSMLLGLEEGGRSNVLFEAQQLSETARALGALRLLHVLENVRNVAPGDERQWIEEALFPAISDTRIAALAIAHPIDPSAVQQSSVPAFSNT